ncbi:MAG TPA: hypothetical protein VIA18_08850 [Polyangia bacterium]|jgi:hypothetical protein|nr:hypothetical protein [Polyangia bacterium]
MNRTLHIVRQLTQDLEAADKEPARAAFVERSVRGILLLAQQLHGEELSATVASRTDYEVLLRALEQPAALALTDDPLAAARTRGVQARQQLLNADGGSVSGAKAAEVLGLSRQAIDKRRKQGSILAVKLGKRGYIYPAWQFSDRGVLPGLSEVLQALAGHSDWAKLRFFLSPNSALNDARPLELLRRDDVAPVLRAARLSGEQSAP